MPACARFASRHPGPTQQYLAQHDTPVVEVAFDLQGGEDAHHKLTTFCGVEEIAGPTKHSLFSAMHTLLQDERTMECTRHTALPPLASVQQESALSTLHDRTSQWQDAYKRSWQKTALQADLLTVDNSHVLTAGMIKRSTEALAADEFSVPVRSLVDERARTYFSLLSCRVSVLSTMEGVGGIFFCVNVCICVCVCVCVLSYFCLM